MALLHSPVAFYVGDEWFIDGMLHNADGTPFQLTGSPVVAWKLEDDLGTILLSFTLGQGIDIVDSTAGRILITVTPLQSAGIAVGRYKDQCRATGLDGAPGVQWVGSIDVRKSFFAP